MKTRIWVRYHASDGPIVVEQDGKQRQARSVYLSGPSKVVFNPKASEQPHIWIETEHPISISI